MDALIINSCPVVPCPTNGTDASIKSILSVEVSCFANYRTPDNPRTVNLLTWLTSQKYCKQVESVRAMNDKKQRDRIKATLPAISPSGLFSRREESALIRHSGLICLDIDFKGNESIANYKELRHQLCRIKNIAYCGQSVSGTGYFVLIPIAYPAQHGSQFRALRELFQRKYGVRIDDTPDVSRLRGYSYDPDGYFNHSATPFSGLYTPPPINPVKKDKSAYSFKPDNFSEVALHRCIRLIEDAPDGQKHAHLNRAAYTAGGYIAGGIIGEVEAVAALEDAISRKANVADLRAACRTIKDGIRDGKQYPIDKDQPESYFKYSMSQQWDTGQMGQESKTLTSPTGEPSPNIVQTIADQIVNPGSILKPDESKIERLMVDSSDNYPNEWDEPSPLDAVPTIKARNFFEWQQQHPPFNQMGLASLKSQ